MKKIIEVISGNTAKIQTSLSTLIKIILIISIFYSTYHSLWQILFANILLLVLLFIPLIMKNKYEVYIPREFEFIFLIFIIISFFLGAYRGTVIQVFFGIAVGFIGFTIMLILFSNSRLRTSYLLIVVVSFSISVTAGVAAEMLKYYLKMFLGSGNTIGDYQYAMKNLTLVSIGALFSSFIGYFYMKGYRMSIMQDMVKRFKNKNPNFFVEHTDSPEEVIKLIQKGENEKLEFKSTLRTNLHTGEHDKRVENSVLKTVVAFLNSEGGVLLIGISDNGIISGIEKDCFENNDKFNRHFTNLVKERIGNEFLPYMRFELIQVEEKNVLKVECMKSDRPVFLKYDSQEEFYIRVGSSTLQLGGSKVLEYVSHKFKKV